MASAWGAPVVLVGVDVHQARPGDLDGLAQVLLLNIGVEGVHHDLDGRAADHFHQFHSLLGQVDETGLEAVQRLYCQGDASVFSVFGSFLEVFGASFQLALALLGRSLPGAPHCRIDGASHNLAAHLGGAVNAVFQVCHACTLDALVLVRGIAPSTHYGTGATRQPRTLIGLGGSRVVNVACALNGDLHQVKAHRLGLVQQWQVSGGKGGCPEERIDTVLDWHNISP